MTIPNWLLIIGLLIWASLMGILWSTLCALWSEGE